jgi:putative sterol carrier protein
MLAFHDESKRIARPTTWELRLSDSAFTARAEGTNLTVTAGAPESADLVITTKDELLHGLMTRQLTPDTAVATGAVTLNGDATALPRLLELLVFPPSE